VVLALLVPLMVLLEHKTPVVAVVEHGIIIIKVEKVDQESLWFAIKLEDLLQPQKQLVVLLIMLEVRQFMYLLILEHLLPQLH